AAEKGGSEVSLAVLAATVTTSIVFLPVAALSGVSKYLFTPLALGVVLSMFASYAFAMTVIPLFCSMFLNAHEGAHEEKPKRRFGFQPVIDKFNYYFQKMVEWYEGLVRRSLVRPGLTTAVIMGGVVVCLAVTFPFLGLAYFPRTDPGQFVINVRMPDGTRLGVSNDYIARVEDIIRQTVKPSDLGMIVSNIGVYPDLSSIFTPNASMDTAFVQTSLKEGHSIGSYEYMRRVREKLSREMPELTTYFHAGGLIDGVINQGMPAPIEVQISSNNMDGAYALAEQLAAKIRTYPNVSSTYIPQDISYPGIQLNIDRERASLIGLSAKDVVDNVITAMTSDGMVAPSYWIDPKTGNNYMVTVQYANRWINHMTMQDFENIPLRGVHPPGFSPLNEEHTAGDIPANEIVGAHDAGYTPLSSVANINLINTPTEVDHYQIRRVIDIYVATKTEALGRTGNRIRSLIANTRTDKNTRISLRGAVVSMNESFRDFGVGLIIAIALVYLVLMAQFTSFADPFIILMAIPPGIVGVVLILVVTGSTLNIMSLMGTIMMTGIVVSNSILIVDFSNILHGQGLPLLEATVESCKMRLRPILMTSLATLLGMIPMAIGAEAGSEQYAPLARAIIGGLGVSVVLTMFVVPAVYLIIHSRQERIANEQEGAEA
ncbi:MAG: efflux RND transporter permease subunit, partial [Acidobacteriaceae bacterium]